MEMLAVAGSSDGNDSTVVSGDVDDDIVLVIASCKLLTGESSGRIFDLTACADEDDGRDDVDDDDEAMSLRLRDDRIKKDVSNLVFFDVILRYYNNHKHV